MEKDSAINRILRKEDGGRDTGKKRVGPKNYYDYTLLFLVLFLIGFGLVMIYSISAYNATKYYSNATLFVKNQAKYAVAGLVLMLLISKIDYHVYIVKFGIGKVKTNLLIIGLVIAMGLQLFVLFKGDGTNGSNRWLSLGKFFKLQPSEISKVLIILVVAYIVYVSPKRLDRMTGFIRVLVFTAPLIVFVAIENLTTALIMAGIVFVVPFVTSRKSWYFFIAFAIVVVVGIAFIHFEGYRAARVQVWKDIENAPGGYQILQGLYAIASGGWFGKGPGFGFLHNVFAHENDIVFATISEEWGLLYALMMTVVLLFICSSPLIFPPRSYFHGTMCAGICAAITVQMALNIFGSCNLIPFTGVTIPFISAGGSSMVTSGLMVGMLIAAQNPVFTKVKKKKNQGKPKLSPLKQRRSA